MAPQSATEQASQTQEAEVSPGLGGHPLAPVELERRGKRRTAVRFAIALSHLPYRQQPQSFCDARKSRSELFGTPSEA
jgi:hypothetical protein